MRFTKMHALGNDFVVIDSRGLSIEGPKALAIKLCHRKFGIGADQMLVLADSTVSDFRMMIYNPDGSEVEMCGNGIRCLAKYIWDRGLSDKDPLEIETLAGTIKPARSGDMVRVDMGEPVLEGRRIPVDMDGRVIDHPLTVNDRTFDVTCVSMGNPHAVVFMDDAEGFQVGGYGPGIEKHAFFPNRTNVEFVTVRSREELRMRVWERGAGETLACGTGASASAVASHLKGLTGKKVRVCLDGGDLMIEWGEDNHVYMTGPATGVFEGEITF